MSKFSNLFKLTGELNKFEYILIVLNNSTTLTVPISRAFFHDDYLQIPNSTPNVILEWPDNIKKIKNRDYDYGELYIPFSAISLITSAPRPYDE